MNLKVATKATSFPISKAEVKAHLRLPSTYTTEDSYIDSLIAASYAIAELRTNRALLETTFRATFDKFPKIIEINKTPLISITSITYIDTAGQTQTLDSSHYLIDADAEPFRITPAYGESWPSTQNRINAVTVTFKAGYSAASEIPKNIIQAMLMLCADLFKNRETVIIGRSVNQIPIPLTVEALFDLEKVQPL